MIVCTFFKIKLLYYNTYYTILYYDMYTMLIKCNIFEYIRLS